MIRPIPSSFGVGFCSDERLPQYASSYREEQVGRYWNYYVTPHFQAWPEGVNKDHLKDFVIDAFSPNLNKSLHVGHLRQLAMAKCLDSMTNCDNQELSWYYSLIWRNRNDSKKKRVRFVSLLGVSIGFFDFADKELQKWFDFVGYHPEIFYDVLMPQDYSFVPRTKKIVLDPKNNEESEVEVWNGPKGDVIVVRSNGCPTYSFYDISFAAKVAPTHYITGVEQKEHFQNLGLEEKHLPMGLVLGMDGKKMKSRTGDSVSAVEIIDQIKSHFDPTPNPDNLAWNVLAWNFLHVGRNQNIKFNPTEWTKSTSPGMYITYTYARCFSALKNESNNTIFNPMIKKAIAHLGHVMQAPEFQGEPYVDGYVVNQKWMDHLPTWSNNHPDPEFDLNQEDADLIGFANQYDYYLNRSIKSLDPSSLASYVHELAKKLNNAYHSEKVKDGRFGFKYAFAQATGILSRAMNSLGMFCLESV